MPDDTAIFGSRVDAHNLTGAIDPVRHCLARPRHVDEREHAVAEQKAVWNRAGYEHIAHNITTIVNRRGRSYKRVRAGNFGERAIHQQKAMSPDTCSKRNHVVAENLTPGINSHEVSILSARKVDGRYSISILEKAVNARLGIVTTHDLALGI